MIVKVQKPIMTNDPKRPFFVYAEGHTNARGVPEKDVPKHVRGALKYRFRAFFEAEWSGKHWVIGKQVKAQDW